jgi:hypothetical protein
MVGEAFLAGIATNFASDVLAAAYRGAQVRVKGPAEKRALERAFARALEGLAAEMTARQFPGQVPSRGEQQLLEEQLERFVRDPHIARLLVAVALEGKELPIGVLRQRLFDLGIDESTMLADFEATMIRFQLVLGAQLRESAGTAASPLFNMYVIGKLAALVERLGRLEQVLGDPGAAEQPPFGVPQLGSHFVGRDDEVRQLRDRLTGPRAQGDAERTFQVLTAMHGWPGVGKTTLAIRMAGDQLLREHFPDGVLWASLGGGGRTSIELASWVRQLRLPLDVLQAPRADMSRELTRALRDRRALLVIDDVWDPADARWFMVGGPGCATLVTTRLPEVAGSLARAASEVFPVSVLNATAALDLLGLLAPEVVARHQAASAELLRALEYLPLAIQVAGRLLQEESGAGWGVDDLLTELRAGARLLSASAPADTAVAGGPVPTVSALLRRSTDQLSDEDRLRFAYLGAFKSRPATFDLEDIAYAWDSPRPRDAQETTLRLVRLGLLEPIGPGRYQMHSLLAVHACVLLEEAG